MEVTFLSFNVTTVTPANLFDKPTVNRLLEPLYEGTSFLPDTANYSPDTATHPRRPESSATPM
jgi:hypothetical protein